MNTVRNEQPRSADSDHIIKVISEMLTVLGRAIKKTDQMFIWRNYHNYPGESMLYKEQIFEWNKGIIGPDCSKIEHKLEEVIMPPELVTEMLADRVVHGPTKDMTDLYSKALLEENGVKSSLMVAIFVGGKLWGCLSLDNCTTEEEWNEDEIALVRKYSKQFGEYIEHGKLYATNGN